MIDIRWFQITIMNRHIKDQNKSLIESDSKFFIRSSSLQVHFVIEILNVNKPVSRNGNMFHFVWLQKIVWIIAPKQTISRNKLTKFSTHHWKVLIQFLTTSIDNTMLQTSINIFALVLCVFWIWLQHFDFINLWVIHFLDNCIWFWWMWTQAQCIWTWTRWIWSQSWWIWMWLTWFARRSQIVFHFKTIWWNKNKSQKLSFTWRKMSTSAIMNKFSRFFVTNTRTSNRSISW